MQELQITLKGETLAKLQGLATPFVDTPETVIDRLADDALARRNGHASEPGATKKRKHLSPGVALSIDEYKNAVLLVLHEMGGSGRRPEVRDAAYDQLKDKLGDVDRQPIASGAPRWRNRTGWARQRLVDDGLIRSDSERGVWELTEEGAEAAARLAASD
jgi:hypothetical protein